MTDDGYKLSGPTTVTLGDVMVLRYLNPGAWESLLEWTREIDPPPPVGWPTLWWRAASLGEGVVTVRRLVVDEHGEALVEDDHFVTEVVEFPAPTPPPCWPVGLAAEQWRVNR